LVERPRRSPENYGATCQPAASIVPSTLIVAPPRDERSTRNVTVTPSGEELLAVIDGVLDAFDERILAFESFTRLERGVLAVIDAAIGSGCSISFDPSGRSAPTTPNDAGGKCDFRVAAEKVCADLVSRTVGGHYLESPPSRGLHSRLPHFHREPASWAESHVDGLTGKPHPVAGRRMKSVVASGLKRLRS
jgi:hypothetical protein